MCKGSQAQIATMKSARRNEPLSRMLARTTSPTCEGRVSVGDLTRLLGDRSLEATLLVLALPMFVPVPAPGISVAFGLPMMVLSAQLALGRRQMWLPSKLSKWSMSCVTYKRALDGSLPVLRHMERIVRPRCGWLAGPWTRVPVGLICMLLAVIIALPVPLGHFVPGLAISLLALGLLERDGIVIGVGLVIALVGLALVLLASFGLREFAISRMTG